MKTVTLELQEMQSIRQLHQYLRRVLALPAYYGENLDALYDCLTEVSEPVILKIPQAVAAGSELGWYGERLLLVMQDAAAANPDLQVEFI
ncbi:barstar family protein [Phascolarctobacterium sp.]|uniref:barstar family protein n=1 Tax=Phascolarctobacterium sp. TaxID=2049039 RepID=UPI0025DCB7C8|nr:barstar family protein [uncultured Phascolarctobacterium sp.]